MADAKRRQLLAGAALLLVLTGIGIVVHRFWWHELSRLTGKAQWVWVTDSLKRVRPAAGLFVASLRLESPPGAALLKVCGDREYVAYVNGTAAGCGWSRPGFRLDLYEVGHLLRQGDNVIAFEVRSPTPVGALLFALDVDDVGTNILVSGPDTVLRSWFSLAPPTEAEPRVSVVWGRPPRFPWAYPPPLSHPRTLDEAVVEETVRVPRDRAVELPQGGWMFPLAEAGEGYLWLEFEEPGVTWVYPAADPGHEDVGLARDNAEPVIRLDGQSRWLGPEPRTVAKVFVFGNAVPSAVELWPVPAEFRRSAPGVVPGTHAPVPRTRWTTRTRPE
ncbi:MAG: hypothetical protein ACOY3Y_16210 [Acidobacteriota bacterium]